MPLDLLPSEIFAYFLVFARVGSLVMLLPALGETSVPVPVRLSLALVLSFVILPFVRDSLPALPADLWPMTTLLVGEILVGLVIGISARIFVSALHVAGMVIAYQAGLGAAMAFDPVQSAQGALFGTFLMLVGVTLIFATGLHYVMIAAMRDSYSLLNPAQIPGADQFARLVVGAVARSFRIGIEMAAPFLVYGLVFNIGLGLIARLMPQLQVFFIAMPLNIVLGFAVLLVSIGGIMGWFLAHFEDFITQFLR